MSNILITGCDRSIGRAMAMQLQARGEHVIAVCLSDPPDLHDSGIRVEPNIDVTEDAALADISKRLGDAPSYPSHPVQASKYQEVMRSMRNARANV